MFNAGQWQHISVEPKAIFLEGSTEILYFLMHITVHWTSPLSNSEMSLVHDKQFHRQWDSQSWIGWQPNFWSLPKYSFNKWCLSSWSLMLFNKIFIQVIKKHFICKIKFLFCFIKGYCSFNSIPILMHSCSFHFMYIYLLFLFYIFFSTHPAHKIHDDWKWLDIFQSPLLFWPKNHDSR